MASTLNTTVPYPNGTKDLNFDASFPVGTLEAPHGTVTDAQVFEVSCSVNATAATPALTSAQRLSVLAAFSVTFRQHLAAPGENGGTLDPIQDVPLDDVRLDALRLLSQEVELLDDTVTGLAKAFVLGSNTITFRVFLPTGHVEKIAESELFSGLSREQLLDCEMKLKKAGDPFKTAAAALTLTACQVRFSPGTKKAEARRIGIVPHARRVVNAQSDTITTPPGLVLELSHKGALASTPLTALQVSVNGDTVTDDPSTPREVYADFMRKMGDTISDPEKTITSARTPVYVVARGAMTRMYSGAVSAKQRTKTAEWDGRALYIPLLSHQEVMGLIKRYAARLETGQAILAVNTAMYEGLDIEDRLIPYCGFTVFRQDEEGFHDYSGIYCAKGGNPYVVVPEQRLRMAALKVADAMRPSQRFPGGNRALVRSIVLDECRWVPGSITHPDGFRLTTAVREDVTRFIRDAAMSLNGALAAAL
ncbi:hypothetical protein ACLEPN_22020 [Myxococcus sp. 1LA]